MSYDGDRQARIRGLERQPFGLNGVPKGSETFGFSIHSDPFRPVLIDTSARPETAEARAKREALIELAASDLDAVTEQLLPRLSHPERMNLPAVRGVIQSMALSLGKEVFARQQQAIMQRPDSRPTLAAIDCPALVICGQQDLITPPELASEMVAGIKHAELEIIDQCGHLSTLDQPEKVSLILLDWITARKF